MDMLEIHKLQIIVDRIMRQTVKDGDCDLWINTVNTSPERSNQRQPRIRLDGRTSKQTRCIEYLWQYHYGQPIPQLINHNCHNNARCLNINHKSLFKPKPRTKKSEQRRRFARHTPECGGIDPIMVERIIQAGTIEAIPEDTYICDCERAYILKYVAGGSTMLDNPSTHTRHKLLQINV